MEIKHENVIQDHLYLPPKSFTRQDKMISLDGSILGHFTMILSTILVSRLQEQGYTFSGPLIDPRKANLPPR